MQTGREVPICPWYNRTAREPSIPSRREGNRVGEQFRVRR